MSAGNNSAVTDTFKPVSVKTLVEFAAKSGSLDRRFTPGPTALEGIEGHKRVVARRSADYQPEISLSIHYKDLLIRGRADGYQPAAHCIEEIKTFYGDVEKIPANHRALHWAQAKMYGWMLCQQQDVSEITLALIYFHLGEQKEYRFEETFSATELQHYGEQLAEIYRLWQLRINKRLGKLADWIDHLAFPHGEFRPTQRKMAEAVYKAAAGGRVLLAQAPTGTGKTLAGLFPAIKSFNKTAVDKIFYLTAKTPGKQLALENIQLIASDASAGPLRTLELTAKEKSCLEPDTRCAGDSCIYALNFYDKLPAARAAAYELPLLDKSSLADLAHEHQICPFYLSMEMSRWVDVVVADFNYFFDANALLAGLTKQFGWHPYLLVDESHNLLERGRQMYSAALNRGDLLNAKRHAPKVIKKSLTQVNRLWLDLLKTLESSAEKLTLLQSPPEKLSLALTGFINQYLEILQQQPDHPLQQTPVQEFFFDALNYQAIQELVDDDYCIDMHSENSKNEVLTLRNLVPARLLAQRLTLAHCACFFSATLQPAFYYRELLGLPENSVYTQVDSPFHADQLVVRISHNLSTRYRDRSAAIAPICDIVKQQLITESGNYLIFLPSYEFLQQLEPELVSELQGMDIQILTQSRRMGEKDRDDFIKQFSQKNNLLGLAVLGGAFSEGIDLPGDALKGAFIATLGLPQFNRINEQMRQYLQSRYQQGYNFTYLYPGLQKVVQAAGRVIRTKNDKGYLWLLDDRFAQPEVKRLLPDWWKIS